MHFSVLLLLATLSADPLTAGDHHRSLTASERERSYLVHVPPGYDAKQPTPIVLILHGAATNADITVRFTGLNKKADEAGFIAVYPNGTGLGEVLLTWNAGGLPEQAVKSKPDDVAFISQLLDELQTVLNVDPKRVYATGMSNGGMMCYRLAAELSDRIAAIAPVAGTMSIDHARPTRPVPVMHFHGTEDTLVPFSGIQLRRAMTLKLKSVPESIRMWCELNGCTTDEQVFNLPDKADDGTTVIQKSYGPGKDNSEVILFEIAGGGHTWPGRDSFAGRLLGKSTLDISANDLIWEFFQRHPMP